MSGLIETYIGIWCIAGIPLGLITHAVTLSKNYNSTVIAFCFEVFALIISGPIAWVFVSMSIMLWLFVNILDYISDFLTH